eukprot:TRINITY_DN1966_c0_g1_i1.p1 TRINITY_DN1966_c0_g1~~TRINITY_DN1966_c0_g1_i1.p1  ORF type:complete len:295 (+),score=46.56 TRINITY_DN1966_c0_g1_i1:145-1029(+)
MSLQVPEDRIAERLEALSLKQDKETLQTQAMTLANMVRTATVGIGNFGCVHLVRNRLLDKVFAIKVMNKRDIVRGKQIEHVFSEKNVLMMIKNHPFVTQLHATFIDNRNLYLCMDYCPGGDLFRVIRDHGNLSHPTAAFYGAEVVLCFEFLHERKIAFRDLKPENVLVAADGHIKLCDFGFAKEVKDRTWTLCGTPEYLAPEVLLGEGHNTAVDWWSFGILLFEMMAGFPPFPGARPMEIYDKILDGVYTLPPFFYSFFKGHYSQVVVSEPSYSIRQSGGRCRGCEEASLLQFD